MVIALLSMHHDRINELNEPDGPVLRRDSSLQEVITAIEQCFRKIMGIGQQTPIDEPKTRRMRDAILYYLITDTHPQLDPPQQAAARSRYGRNSGKQTKVKRRGVRRAAFGRGPGTKGGSGVA